MEQKAVNQSDQWGTLSTHGLLCHSEICHSRNTGDGTNNCALPKAKCRARLPLFWHGEKPNSLSMRSDEVNAVHRYLVLVAKLLNGITKHLSKLHIELRHF
jgi:hypothetical protein